jgi:uncharacterized protein YeaO (DUF488 family)
MIKIKHLFDATEGDDGTRLWIESIGLTKDLSEWCAVDHVLSHLGPPVGLAQWFEEHPDGYDYFRATYHEWLSNSRYRPALLELAKAGQRQTVTLVHTGDDPGHNSGTALYEYLSALQSPIQPDSPET